VVRKGQKQPAKGGDHHVLEKPSGRCCIWGQASRCWLRSSTGPRTRGSGKQTSACNDWPSPIAVSTEAQRQTVERAAGSQRGNSQGKTNLPITMCRKLIINCISIKLDLLPIGEPSCTWVVEHNGRSARSLSVTQPSPMPCGTPLLPSSPSRLALPKNHTVPLPTGGP